ncbi:hypothetical protein BH10PLA1_BH10PLA1_18300 [soil metagenome]
MIRFCTQFLAALIVLTIAGTCGAASLKDRIAAADAAMTAKNYPEAITLFSAIADNPKVPLDDRVRSYTRIIDAERQQKNLDDAIAVYAKLFALPLDDARRKDLTMAAASLNKSAGHVPVAISTLNDLAAKYPDDDEIYIDAHLTAATYLTQDKKPAEVADQLTLALKRLDADDPRTAGVIWNLSDAQWNSEQYDKSIQTARQLTDEKYSESPKWINRDAHNRVIAALLKLKKTDDAVAQLHEWEKTDPSEVWRQRWAVRAAQTLQESGNIDAAMTAYRNLLTHHAQAASIDGWYEAQTAIVDRLTHTGDFAGALKAAHILLDASPDFSSQAASVQRISELFQKLDGKKARAKAFIAFQLYGPAGKDGSTGTSDDPQDPLKAVGYPDDAEREKAFAAAFATVGDDAAAMYHRAQMCVYSGRPQEAVLLYREALRRSSDEDWPTFAFGLVMNGLRPVNGTSVGLNGAATFLLYGPAGADGKLKTDDDRADPFAAITAPNHWPLPAMAATDRDAISALQQSLHRTILDDSLPGSLRQAAVRALTRTDEALDTVSEIDPFVDLTGDADRAVSDAALGMVMKLARGNEIHLAKLREFLATDALPTGASKKADAELKKYAKSLVPFTTKNGAVPKVSPIKD